MSFDLKFVAVSSISDTSQQLLDLCFHMMMWQLWWHFIGSYKLNIRFQRIGQHRTGQQAAQEHIC